MKTVHSSGSAAEAIGAPSRQQAEAAAKAAGVHAFISELPEGYDTPVGEGGIPLAPSHRTRIDLARRLAADPSAALCPGARGVPEDLAPPSPRPTALPADDALPTLGRLLDAEAMTAVLGRALGSSRAPHVRVRTVRYKPGDNVVVHYDVGSDSGWHGAVTYATATGQLEHKLSRRAKQKLMARAAGRVPAPEPLSYEEEVGALLQWLPLDVRLKLLIESGSELAARLGEVGLVVEPGEEPVLLRYWPRRRAVIRLGTHVIKLYRDPGDFAVAAQGLRAASRLSAVKTAPCEAVLDDKRVTVQGLIPGRSPSLAPGSSEDGGAVLAELHRASVPGLTVFSTADLLAKTATRAAFVGRLLPGLATDLAALLAALESTMPDDARPVTSHGNFHAGQLLDTGAGLAVIDMDRVCVTHPAYDLASYASHLAFGGCGYEADLEVINLGVESLVTGYGSRPPDFAWFLAACLLRRALVPFRYLDEHWPEAMAVLVLAGARVLER